MSEDSEPSLRSVPLSKAATSFWEGGARHEDDVVTTEEILSEHVEDILENVRQPGSALPEYTRSLRASALLLQKERDEVAALKKQMKRRLTKALHLEREREAALAEATRRLQASSNRAMAEEELARLQKEVEETRRLSRDLAQTVASQRDLEQLQRVLVQREENINHREEKIKRLEDELKHFSQLEHLIPLAESAKAQGVDVNDHAAICRWIAEMLALSGHALELQKEKQQLAELSRNLESTRLSLSERENRVTKREADVEAHKNEAVRLEETQRHLKELEMNLSRREMRILEREERIDSRERSVNALAVESSARQELTDTRERTIARLRADAEQAIHAAESAREEANSLKRSCDAREAAFLAREREVTVREKSVEARERAVGRREKDAEDLVHERRRLEEERKELKEGLRATREMQAMKSSQWTEELMSAARKDRERNEKAMERMTRELSALQSRQDEYGTNIQRIEEELREATRPAVSKEQEDPVVPEALPEDVDSIATPSSSIREALINIPERQDSRSPEVSAVVQARSSLRQCVVEREQWMLQVIGLVDVLSDLTGTAEGAPRAEAELAISSLMRVKSWLESATSRAEEYLTLTDADLLRSVSSQEQLTQKQWSTRIQQLFNEVRDVARRLQQDDTDTQVMAKDRRSSLSSTLEADTVRRGAPTKPREDDTDRRRSSGSSSGQKAREFAAFRRTLRTDMQNEALTSRLDAALRKMKEADETRTTDFVPILSESPLEVATLEQQRRDMQLKVHELSVELALAGQEGDEAQQESRARLEEAKATLNRIEQKFTAT